MRFGIAFKVGLLATALVCATGLGIGVWAFFQAARIVVEHELVDLRDEAKLKAEHLLLDVAALREDVLYLTRTPQVQAIVRARNSANAAELTPKQRTDPVTGRSEHALREELGKGFRSNMPQELTRNPNPICKCVSLVAKIADARSFG